MLLKGTYSKCLQSLFKNKLFNNSSTILSFTVWNKVQKFVRIQTKLNPFFFFFYHYLLRLIWNQLVFHSAVTKELALEMSQIFFYFYFRVCKGADICHFIYITHGTIVMNLCLVNCLPEFSQLSLYLTQHIVLCLARYFLCMQLKIIPAVILLTYKWLSYRITSAVTC